MTRTMQNTRLAPPWLLLAFCECLCLLLCLLANGQPVLHNRLARNRESADDGAGMARFRPHRYSDADRTCAWLMVGGSHARFALSREAILIKASDKVLGFLPHAVLISPGDKPSFLRALAEATPHLQQGDDGGVRCRAEQ